MTLTKVWYQGRWQQTLTPRFLMALLSSWTTSIPSTPLALKRLVHVIRKPWRQPKKARGKSKRSKSLLSVHFLGWVCKLWGLVTGKGWREVCCLAYLIQFGLLAGEGEGETNWKFLVFDVVFFHEVTKTLCNMVKQLEWRWKEGEVFWCGAQNTLFICVYISL